LTVTRPPTVIHDHGDATEYDRGDWTRSQGFEPRRGPPEHRVAVNTIGKHGSAPIAGEAAPGGGR